MLKDEKIAIIGGGPGGLTLARLLQIEGINLKVYERDINKDVRVQGATLDLHQESGLKALNHAGLMEAFKKNYRPGADKIRIVDNTATVFYDQHTEETEENFDAEYFRPEIDRGPLRTMLLESLEPGTVVWDSQFVTMSESNNGWVLAFKNGSTANADIVIGADGANSKIRPFITPIKPFYSGVTVVEGAVYHSETSAPDIHRLLQGGKIFAFGGEKDLIVSSKGDGSLAFYASFKTTEHWVNSSGIDFSSKEQVLTWFKQEFAEWDTSWYELFENATSYLNPRPIYCMPLDQTWSTLSNLTILGDAAHLMPPFAGEGVNMAMLDALELSEVLTSADFKDNRSALQEYETQMLQRSSEIAEMSLDNTRWMHGENALSLMLDMFGQSK